ncbi:MAG: hypothetical protein ACE5JD_15115 [Candidatus Methylomirabilia bacterium]
MIGATHPRLGGERFVSGAARYVADVRVTGMLEAAVLRARHAHARIISIDVRRALAVPGVHAVLPRASPVQDCTVWHRAHAAGTPHLPLAHRPRKLASAHQPAGRW